MATKSQAFPMGPRSDASPVFRSSNSSGSRPSGFSSSTTPLFNKRQGVGAVSAAAADALSQRSKGRGFDKASMNKSLTFAKDFGTAFGQNLGKTALDMGKSILKSPLRVGTSLAEIPRVLSSGGSKTFEPYNVPFLGEVKTYSRDARDRINAGDGSKTNTAATILGVGGQAMLETAALGSLAQGVKNKFFSKSSTPQVAGSTPQQSALNSKISGGQPTVNAGGREWTVDQIHNTSSTALKKLSPADYKKLTEFDVAQSRAINFKGGRTGPVNLLDATPKKTVNLLDPNYKPSAMTPSSEILNKGRAYQGSVEKIISDSEGWGAGVKTMFDKAMLQGDKMAVKAILKAQGVPATYQKTFAKEIGNILKGGSAYAK